ncbi:MAG: bifunctional (p)ppGpp synthetase/guanosine-3',5'-bis(diphosphate) 3'-pyrophosphohydrolase, partial [Candidatus Marinimicrobia bacterium]|nr:bifunctional (p)ppGpp synthetase/guanosine-3',5'-bis(diphosphate) 3'-pyrophosphohydrolase [Candidatus Neomarinimicrobiota bacterium]
FRRSGEPYFEHVYQTALILTDLSMDATTICSGMLHDIVEDTAISEEIVAKEFSPTIAFLVKGVTKIGGIKFNSEQEQQAENFRKMLLGVAEDIRVLIIKFADRLHNMRTLGSLPLSKQRRIAIETRDVYAPLAHRLGMYRLKMEMEDLALKYLEPRIFNFLEKKISTKREELEAYINNFTGLIDKKLRENDIEAVIFGRLKHFYSIYNKMKKQNKPFEEIYDVLAIRVIVNTLAECYEALGYIHQLFRPIPERFRDFIAHAKSNGYQSIHTTVIGPGGKFIEIQIRTHEMHKQAEVGIAAHWKYKEEKEDDDSLDKHIQWLRDLVEMLKSDPTNELDFMETLKIDLFKDEIFVFTPKGDLITLPKGSTTLDFAFAVHTEIGLHCIGAKVNGKIVPLNTELSNGDQIEIITSANHWPSYNWLKYVRTSKARSRIRKWLQRNEFEQSVKLGKEILEKGLRRLKIPDKLKDVRERYQEMGYQTQDLFYQDLGKGELTLRDVVNTLLDESDKPAEKEFTFDKILRPFTRSTQGVTIQGLDNVMVQFAKCCNPIPGDEIVGFITRGRGITVHRSNCKNIPKIESEKDRLIDVTWDLKGGRTFIACINIICEDRKNMMYDIMAVIREMNTNMLSVNFDVEGKLAKGQVSVMVENVRHASRIISKLQKIPGVLSVERT